MKILVEGISYPVDELLKLFEDPKFYVQNGLEGKINSVGYYHSFEKNTLVFMLPKVVMRDGTQTIFGCSASELFDLTGDFSVKHKIEFNWIRQLSVYFYKSLIEFRNRYYETSIIHSTQTFDFNTNFTNKEYSFLDLLLSFVNFYKKNKQQIIYKHIEHISNQVKKPKWEKAIRKSLPVVINGSPIYLEVTNTKKNIYTEEQLLIYFFSILNRLNKDHFLNLRIDKSLNLIEGERFDRLCENGVRKLKKIKYRYFDDTLKKMYLLCELYFSQFDKSGVRKKKEDFLSVNNYNIVFEDMVDKLFSDNLSDVEVDGVTIEKLKHNSDGKIIDHIYDYKSLIDTSNIFYIGDSKYYKAENVAGSVSKYKQFTYAKNIIQYNIDLLNNNRQYSRDIRYRDHLTEGYNITPNFFVYGYVDEINDYVSHLITEKADIVSSCHFKDRLFDRDTLYVHQYKINFLYVLKSYSTFNNNEIETFRKEVKETFRNNFLRFFNDKTICGFEFFESNISVEDYAEFIEKNFKKINGKCYCTADGRLILAKHTADSSLIFLMDSFTNILKLE